MNKLSTIFDAHTHYQKQQEKLANVSKRLVMINPWIDAFGFGSGVHRHFYDVNGKIAIKAEGTLDTVYFGEDPYFELNKELFEDKTMTENDYLFVLPALTKKNINNKIKYFIDTYGSRVAGAKMYTGSTSVTLDEIGKLDTEIPIMIHTGIGYNQDPKNMLKFIKNYKGKICLAHFAKFEKSALDVVKKSDNIYVDTSPAHYIFSKEQAGEKRLFDNTGISRVEDLYYKIIDAVGIDKVIWGSDTPHSNQERELNTALGLDLTLAEKEKILCRNAESFLSR